MNIDLLELAARSLGDLLPEVVFLGGATVGLWITDPGAPEPRPTRDIDVVVECTSALAFHDFQDRLRKRGFAEDIDSGVICRWGHQASQLILDAMPSRGEILGFENQWQGASIPYAMDYELPSGQVIRVSPPPYLLAMKLEAFKSRGQGDLLGSRDFGDVIALVDGREELVAELAAAEPVLRAFVAEQVAELLAMRYIDDGLAGALRPDAASQGRVNLVIKPRLMQVTELDLD